MKILLLDKIALSAYLLVLLRPHGVKLPQLDQDSAEILWQHRHRAFGRMDSATPRRKCLETLCREEVYLFHHYL